MSGFVAWVLLASSAGCGGSGNETTPIPPGSSGGAASGASGNSGSDGTASGASGGGGSPGGGTSGSSGASGGVSGGSGGSGSDAGVTGSSSGAGSAGSGSGSGATGGSGIELWHPTVLPFTSTGTYANPYMQASMTAVLAGPGGATLKIPGYSTGGSSWAVRFSPTAVGTWTYTTQSMDAGLNGKTGSIDCIANTNKNLHGPLRVDAANPTLLKYEDGTPYFQLAYEADWLGLIDLAPTDTPAGHARVLIDTIAQNGFHEVLMNLFAYDTSWGSDPMYDFGPTKAFLWGGTNQAPVHTQINPAFFDRFDAVVDYLLQKGLNAHMYFMVYNKGVSWPAVRSPEDAQWWQYVTARYQAYPNIIWDFSKETIGCYMSASHANFADEAYVHERIAIIKTNDAYQRLRTAHAPVNGGATVPGLNYWFDVKPNDLDFYTAEAVQGHNNYANTLAGIKRVGAFPYANDENSYQIGNDGTATYSNAKQTPASVHDDMMEVIMAGAGAGYYYAYHSWDDVRYAEVPAQIGFFKHLDDLFSSHVTQAGLKADDSVIGGGGYGKHCLANPGKEYVVELSPSANTTTVAVNVAQLPAGGSLTATWYDLESGMTTAASPVNANATVTFTKPFAGLGVLLVK
ncbi:MAG: DUF4038 domain-containing protein [Myxococcota bacterium]|nr:DUF4038 domain-containing protein [Myxococcota bacterium]